MSKFDSNNPLLRIELKQPNPRFDQFLQLIATFLNKTSMKILIDILEFEDVRVGSNLIYTNKFLAKLLQKSGSSPRDKTLINKMIQ